MAEDQPSPPPEPPPEPKPKRSPFLPTNQGKETITRQALKPEAKRDGP